MSPSFHRRWVWILLFGIAPLVATGRAAAAEPDDVPPELHDLLPGVQLTLIAEHPDVVTPTGIDVDDQGHVWVVASHTHFRPDDYAGPERDEVLVFDRQGGRRVFYADTRATMDLELGNDGWVYLSERDRVLRVRDTDGDGRGDQRQTIAVLETEADYPHNGLSGLSWHPSGDLLFALGENYWKPWTLTAADQRQITGTGEGGIFRCRPDGSDLRRIAVGFWNPFGVCVREDGEIFAAENDPGARPPCRLIHVVPGGDYGYQRLYGEAPYHPFVCWNGELRGTLPMLHSTGEAPCGVVPLGDGLLVPSWTDHRIDYYPLRRNGASFATERVVLARGGEHFRPTCIAQADATTFYFADWVFGSYQLHGRGRVWKLSIDPQQADWLGSMQLQPPNEAARLTHRLRSGEAELPRAKLLSLAADVDPFVAHAALQALARDCGQWQWDDLRALPADQRLTMTLAIKLARPQDVALARALLQDPDPRIQFESLRWIADRQLQQALPDVQQLLGQPEIDYRLFEAALAAWNTLTGNPRAGVADPEMLLQRLRDPAAAPRSRAFSLRLLSPQLDALTPALLEQLLQLDNPLLSREVMRTLAARPEQAAQRLLAQIADDADRPSELRAIAITGLAGASAEQTARLIDLAESADRAVREEALRSLRFGDLTAEQRQRIAAIGQAHPQSRDLVRAVLDPEVLNLASQRPAAEDLEAWKARLAAVAGPADPAAGERIFFRSRVGMCSSCHRHGGRGNVVGPDLTALADHGQGGDPDRLLTSILQPSRDVDPQYFPWSLVTVDGRVFTGIPLRNGGGGKEVWRDNTGQEQTLITDQIESRSELRTSMMPAGLVETLTDRELRDVLAFLQTPAADAP